MSIGLLVVFGLLAVLAVAGAWKMIFSHHPVHSALYLVLVLCATAGLHLLLGAPFIAVVQVAVYAGAIMVLFLFIIMYLNLGMAKDIVDDRRRRAVSLFAAGLLGVLLLAGGLVRWGGAVAGLPASEVEAGRQAVEQGSERVAGHRVGTPEASEALQAARASGGWQPVSVEDIGVMLFSRYALPFEVASLLLLVAMIGVLVIARPQMMRESGGTEEARR